MGKHGGPRHEAIVNAMRRRLPKLVYEKRHPDDPLIGLIADEGVMLLELGQIDDTPGRTRKGRKPGSKIPDILVIDEIGHVIVEVGKYNPDKWPEHTVIHVGFDLTVTPIGPRRDPIILILMDCIRRAVSDVK